MSDLAYSETFNFERVVVRAFDIVRRNLPLLVTLTLILYGLPRIGAALLDAMTHNLPVFPGAVFNLTEVLYRIAAGLGAFALQAAVMYVAAADLNDRAPNLVVALRTGLRFLLPILGIFIVTVIAVTAGCILLIVPGLIIATLWSVATPAAVVERLDVGSALSRSAWLTQGSRWQVFALAVLFCIAFLIVGGVIMGVQSGILSPFSFIPGLKSGAHEVTSAIIDTVAAMVGAVGVMSIYYELRTIREGATPEDLATVLEA